MAFTIKHNGKTYSYIDTICSDEIIYDVYEDDFGDILYVPIDTIS